MFILFLDSDDVFTHEASSWLETVHEILVLELTVKLSPVVYAIPWLDADEWSVLACWVPDTYARGLEFEGYVRFALLIEDAYLLYLTLVEDDGIISKCLLVYFPDTLVGLYGFLSLAVDAAVHITEEANWCLVVELEGSLHLFALLATWYEECWVTTNLEEDFLVVGVLYMPDDMNLVAFQAIRDSEIEVVRIVLQCLLAVDEGEGETIASLSYELKLCITSKTMAWQVILLAVDAVGIVPKSAYYREEDRRVTVPVLVVAIPKIFVTIGILDALQFCSER